MRLRKKNWCNLGDWFLADEALGILGTLSLLSFQGATMATRYVAARNKNTVPVFLDTDNTFPVSLLVIEFKLNILQLGCRDFYVHQAYRFFTFFPLQLLKYDFLDIFFSRINLSMITVWFRITNCDRYLRLRWVGLGWSLDVTPVGNR